MRRPLAQAGWQASSLVYLAIFSSVGTAGESSFVLSRTDEAGTVLPNRALCADPQFSLYMTPERLLYMFSRRTNVSEVQEKAWSQAVPLCFF